MIADATTTGLIRTCLEIHDKHRDRLESRASSGWKLGLVCWAGLVLFLASLLTNGFSILSLSVNAGTILAGAVGVLSLLAYLCWIYIVGRRNLADAGQARACIDALGEVIASGCKEASGAEIDEQALRVRLAAQKECPIKHKVEGSRVRRLVRVLATWRGQVLQAAITALLVLAVIVVWQVKS